MTQPAQGLTLIATHDLALPYQTWRVSAHVMMARKLRLAEETVLALVDAGLKNPAEISKLMGLSDIRMVQNVVIALMSKGLMGDNLGLYVTDLGRGALTHDQIKSVEVLADLPLRYDPYEDAFRYTRTQGDSIRRPRTTGRHMLPLPASLSDQDVEARHAEIQRLINEHASDINIQTDGRRQRQLQRTAEEVASGGIPGERERFTLIDGQADVLKLEAVEGTTVYLPATLNIYQGVSSGEWHWEVTRGGIRDDAIVERLRQLEREGVSIIPLENAPQYAEGAEAAALHAVASEIVQEIVAVVQETEQSPERTVRPLIEVLSTNDHRSALLQAIRDARSCLLIISPWLKTASVNGELVDSLANAMRSKSELKIMIGYGIEPHTQRRPGFSTKNEDEALRRLRKLQRDYPDQLSLIEVGNTHEKVVLCDDRYAIVTSFNFLSFNPQPGKYVRRETGIRTSERETVKSLLEISLNVFQAVENSK